MSDPAGIEVVALVLGHATPRRGQPPGGRFPIHAFLIRHPEGPFLVDTAAAAGMRASIGSTSWNVSC